MEKNFQQGVRDALPTALGYISIGLACGVVASPYLSPLEMGLMSLLVYAGASQFAMISLIAVHSSLMNIALTVFFINLRNMLMSLHTSPDFKEASLVHNIGIGSLLTDESYGVYLSEKLKSDRITVPWMHGNNVVGYLAWGSSTILGTALGSLLPNPSAFGLDFALVAMFIGIFAGQFQGMRLTEKMATLLLVLGAVAFSFFLLTFFLTQSLAVLVATLTGCFVGVMCDAREELDFLGYFDVRSGHLDSTHSPLRFGQIPGAARSSSAFSKIPSHCHHFCPDPFQSSRGKSGPAPPGPVGGSGRNHSDHDSSLSLQKTNGHGYIWDCLSCSLTIACRLNLLNF